MARFIRRNYKSIINKYKMIDSWFWCRYSINTYNGCQFGCIYCDARSAKYHLPEDFENKIIVKNNVREMLEKRIGRARTVLPDVVVFSGTTDAYQAAEKKFHNTRQCLEVLLKYKYPVPICTTSTLVLRDIDLLNEIGRQNWSTVSVTITTTNEKKAGFLEKLAPTPAERFAVIKKIKEQAPNIQTGVLLIPTIPFLTDSDEDLENMVKKTKDSGADYLLFGGGMTLRDRQATWFINHLKQEYPRLVTEYEKLFDFSYNSDSYQGNREAQKNYSERVNMKLFELCKKYNLAYRIKRFIPSDFRKVNYKIAEKFLNSAYKKQMTGRHWMTSFRAGHEIQNLTVSVKEIAEKGQWHLLKNINMQVREYLKEYLVTADE